MSNTSTQGFENISWNSIAQCGKKINRLSNKKPKILHIWEFNAIQQPCSAVWQILIYHHISKIY